MRIYTLIGILSGRITGYTDSVDGHGEYEYNDEGYLTHASYDAKYGKVLPEESYSYDELGHRVGNSYANDTETDQLMQSGSTSYMYDQNGNETGKMLGTGGSLWRYVYDDLDRLVRIKFYYLASQESAGMSPRWEIEYRYDWAGRLIERRFSGHTNIQIFRVERYVYEGDNVVLMMDGDNEVVARFYHAAGTVDRPVYMETQGQKYYYHYDERGSVIYLTNSQGQIVQRFWYDAFGRLTLDVGMLLPGRLVYTYTGRMWDPYAEVYHYRARVYDPKTGRFLQHDPVFSANPYAYVGNDPINNIDPYGEYIDTVVDVASFSYDVYQYKKDPSLLNAAFIGLDVITTAFPIAAGGGTIGRGAVKSVEKGYEAAKIGVKKILKKEAQEEAEEIVKETSKNIVKKGAKKTAKKAEKEVAKKPDEVYRALSPEDAENLRKGEPLKPKGERGTLDQHVNGEDTGHISATTDKIIATDKYNSGNGVVKIDVKKAEECGSNCITHDELVDQLTDPNAIKKAEEDAEVLFDGPIDPSAIEYLEE